MKTFGENLKAARLQSGLSQVGFAKLMGTTQQRVSEWETGKVEPSLYNLKKIITVLNTTFEEITADIS